MAVPSQRGPALASFELGRAVEVSAVWGRRVWGGEADALRKEANDVRRAVARKRRHVLFSGLDAPGPASGERERLCGRRERNNVVVRILNVENRRVLGGVAQLVRVRCRGVSTGVYDSRLDLERVLSSRLPRAETEGEKRTRRVSKEVKLSELESKGAAPQSSDERVF